MNAPSFMRVRRALSLVALTSLLSSPILAEINVPAQKQTTVRISKPDDYSKRVVRKLVNRCTTDEQILNVLASVSPEATEKIVTLLKTEKKLLKQGVSMFGLIHTTSTWERFLVGFFKALLCGVIGFAIGAGLTCLLTWVFPGAAFVAGGLFCAANDAIGMFISGMVVVPILLGGVFGCAGCTAGIVHEYRADRRSEVEIRAAVVTEKIDQILDCIEENS